MDSFKKALDEVNRIASSLQEKNRPDKEEIISEVGDTVRSLKSWFKDSGYKIKGDDLSFTCSLNSKDPLPEKYKMATKAYKMIISKGFKEGVWDRGNENFQYIKKGKYKLVSQISCGISGIDVLISIE